MTLGNLLSDISEKNSEGINYTGLTNILMTAGIR